MESSPTSADQASPTTAPATASGTFRLGDVLPVHRLGFGAMRLTGRGIWGEPPDRDEAVRVLRRAVALGVTFIDTADAYGPYVSEEIIAEALSPYPSGLVIATKGGLERSGPDAWTTNGRPDHLRHACEGSLRRLRLECIDLYQLHRLDPAVPAEDQLGALKELQWAGKVRLVGLSEVSVPQIVAARAVLPIVTVQNKYSLSDRGHDAVLAYCERERIGFIPWYPLAAGDLARPDAAVQRIAARLGATTAQLALAWLLALSPVMLPIPGTSRVTHLEENIAAAALRLDPGLLLELASAVRSG